MIAKEKNLVKFLKFFIFVLVLPISLFAWKMESGTVQLNSTSKSSEWVRVTLKQSYTTPPLIFSLPTSDGGDPCALRIRNVTNDSFEVLQVESSGEDGPHMKMTVHYLAIDSGEHFLPDGTRIIAGKISTTAQQAYKNVNISTSWESISFAKSFDATPIVLGMIQTLDNEEANIPTEPSKPFLTTVLKDVDSNGFKIALERSEIAVGDVNNSETIAYMAITNNTNGTIPTNSGGILYETASKNDIKGYDNGCYNYNFVNTYSAAPNVLATKQTRKGDNGGWFRRCSLDENQTGLYVEEDRYNDSERTHIKEVGGILVFEKDFAFDSSLLAPVAEYHMDECYWLGSGNFDVNDNINANNAESYNNAQTDQNDAKVNFSGSFGTTGYIQPKDLIPLASNWTLSLWVKFPLDPTDHQDFSGSNLGFDYYFGIGAIEGDGDLVGLALDGSDLKWAVYDENADFVIHDLNAADSGWHHLTFVKTDDDSTTLYVDGVQTDTIALGSDGEVNVFLTSDDNTSGQAISTKVDELKLWNRALTADEIHTIFENEKNGKNYDSSPRAKVTCNTSIKEHSWELIGIPADLRTESDTSINKVFGDDFTGTYGTDWRIYTREYSDNNNSSWYTYLDDVSTPLEFGKAYWLGSKKSESWDVNDMKAVDYNSTNSACTAGTCVEIDLKSVSLDENTEDINGTGPYRYYMSGFTGKVPVDWADCRIIIDGTAFTPSDAETEDYISKTIWQYNSSGDDYTTCDDTTPGSCLLQPYKGFWIELHGPTKGKTVKLLIPKE